jgi:hypothetical protein
VRQIVAPLAVLALLIAPTIGDLLARRGDPCPVSPCCIGKMIKSCPMHPHGSQSGEGIRSCGNDEQAAAVHQVVVVFAASLDVSMPVAERPIQSHLATPSYPETTPPDPTPPRLTS